MTRYALLVVAVLVVGGTLALWGSASPVHGENSPMLTKVAPTNPVAHQSRPHLDHSAYFSEPIQSAQEVTKKCLSCHQDAAKEVMKTAHFTWISGDVERNGKMIRIGKKNLMNNFCISVSGNWASCTKCHAGYGWTDENFDFTKEENVDCLVCHDGSGTYTKGNAGWPGKDVDLAAVAGSVRGANRDNCGFCHFNGGGGMGVKHGDLDDSLLNPNTDIDVHMGRLGFQCVDCHKTDKHFIAGKVDATYTDATRTARFDCSECHASPQHNDSLLNKHSERVACQSCHIPEFARKYPTKMDWDWSKAGDPNRKDDPHEYLKIKGEFRYEEEVKPEYAWYNGKMDRYIIGDKVTSDDQAINQPLGSRSDPNAKIWPFKVHRAKQIIDAENRVLIPPITSGEDGFWKKFDWSIAAQKGMELAGLPYSGQYEFVHTHMFWPITHMVAPAKNAVPCTQCHGPNSRLNWKELGYERDPIGGVQHER